MGKESSDNVSYLPAWFTKLCKWLWKKQGFIWTTIVLGVTLNLLATWLFTPWSTDYKKLPIWVLLQNPLISLLIGILLLLLTFIIYVGNHFNDETTSSHKISNLSALKNSTGEKIGEATLDPNKETKRRYLFRMIRDNETLTLKGVPAGLIDKGVQLEEVFIPLEFRPNQPLTEYPLTERDINKLREYLENGAVPEEMERLLMEAEKGWYYHLSKIDRISITDLWQKMNSKYPAVVIQGYPGMGKSTLLARLTLHLARLNLNLDDPTMPKQLKPSLIPIFLSLGHYASELAEAKKSDRSLSLTAYLELMLRRANIPGLIDFIRESLANSQCLVLFDGLDEVSDPKIRTETQEAIKTFITEQSDISIETTSFNRFIITSRVAGYDQNAFPSYGHYTIAELTPKQIKGFLPRWCQANVYRDYRNISSNQDEERETLIRQAKQTENRLNYAIEHNQGVRELVEFPLMLTLLAVMQQNSIELPRERIELYTIITRTLLENRNIAKNLPIIPEALAIQRLGPIAFQMQEVGNSFARLEDILASLMQTIQREQGGTTDQISQEATNFLSRVRERAGLFTQRTGDYFSFFHRSFQEYFVARHMLNEIKNDPTKGISELLRKARSSDDLWREPFLFAVAYQSRNDETVARKIIQTLLDTLPNDSINIKAHDVLLAGDCMIEVKPATIGSQIEKQIAGQLLQIYEEAQKHRLFTTCTQIERVIQRWLTSLPNESYRPALLTVLSEAINNEHNSSQQYATLTLLAMILPKISFCSSIVFNTLIPLLLKIARLPELNKYSDLVGLSEDYNFSAIDLAISTLSTMGNQGPGGFLLTEIQKHFKNHPQHLQLLAKHSLEMRTLLTPIMIPSSPEICQKYIAILLQWHSLRDQEQGDDNANEAAVNACMNIHQSLLDIGEEVRFPGVVCFLNILNVAENIPDQPAQEIWKTYLCNNINTTNYTFYQEMSVLYLVMFHDQQSLEDITRLIEDHYYADNYVQSYSRRFISNISVLLKASFDQRFILDTRGRADGVEARTIDLRNAIRLDCDVNQYADLFFTKEAGVKETETTKIHIFVLENASFGIKYLNSKNYIRLLFNEIFPIESILISILSNKVMKKTMNSLSSCISSSPRDIETQKELISILLGRLLLIQAINLEGDVFKQEIENIRSFVLCLLPIIRNEEIKNVILDVLGYLPMRSVEEIKYMICLIENTGEEELCNAYAKAIGRSRPKNNDSWLLIKSAMDSEISAISSAAKLRVELENKARKWKFADQS